MEDVLTAVGFFLLGMLVHRLISRRPARSPFTEEPPTGPPYPLL